MKSTEELLKEVLNALVIVKARYNPIRHEKFYAAVDVAFEQTKYALHLRELAKKDPVQNIHDQLREMPLIDNKSKGAGPDQ